MYRSLFWNLNWNYLKKTSLYFSKALFFFFFFEVSNSVKSLNVNLGQSKISTYPLANKNADFLICFLETKLLFLPSKKFTDHFNENFQFLDFDF